VEAHRRPRPADPEFDPSPASPVRLRDFDPLEHQRLVVNPFLAVFGLVVLTEVTRLLLRSSFPPLAVATVIPLVLLPYLIQYHCLDCGQTGRYSRRGRHACPAVFARWQEGYRSRFPSSWTQLVIWSWVIASAALLLAVQAWE
jgi:hypothetical protein